MKRPNPPTHLIVRKVAPVVTRYNRHLNLSIFEEFENYIATPNPFMEPFMALFDENESEDDSSNETIADIETNAVVETNADDETNDY